jgi:hypothetical protein
MNYNIPSWRYLRTIPPKNLSDAATDPIADHRASQRFFYADSITALRPAIGAKENHELPRGLSNAAAINRLKFRAAYQARGAQNILRRTIGSFKWA